MSNFRISDIRIAPAVITLLVASNAVTGYIALRRDPEIHADHLQRIAVDGSGDGLVRIRLGSSSTPFGREIIDPRAAGDLSLAPRAALQLHRELGRMLMTFEAKVATENAVGRSADSTL